MTPTPPRPHRVTGDARKLLAEQAADLYNTPLTVREVASRLGVSYGKAHALITQHLGRDAFRVRGTRAKGVPE